MVGLLMALPGTQLWRRLEKEGRLRGQGTGDQFMRPNFEPTMDEEKLLTGYRGLMADLYTGDAWYDRCEMQLANVVVPPGMRKPHVRDLMALVRAAWAIGIVSGRRRRFWRLLYRSLRSNARTFAWAVSRAVTGEHMVRYTQEHLLPRLDDSIAEVRAEGARRLSDGQLAKTNVV